MYLPSSPTSRRPPVHPNKSSTLRASGKGSPSRAASGRCSGASSAKSSEANTSRTPACFLAHAAKELRGAPRRPRRVVRACGAVAARAPRRDPGHT
eukprot:CAMPEP_0117617282 /NCGR_PEP_ID=MMETSP0784-20121206/85514_1 /TAXON_ID=39447 /ORGANISM="" /LENGTH=95 /DNA_ID=CAMNT_0005421123 /DNA_START=246 /DNA_END=529 /DNA_ORIENTATION=+